MFSSYIDNILKKILPIYKMKRGRVDEGLWELFIIPTNILVGWRKEGMDLLSICYWDCKVST